MSAKDPSSKARRPSTKIPVDVDLKLRHAVDQRLRAGGRLNHQLLREHPDFSPYIGAHLGETGRKRLVRLVADVKASLPKGAQGPRRAASSPTPRDDGLGDAASNSAAGQVASSAQIPTGGATISIGYEQLQSLMQRRIPELERAIAATKNDHGDVVALDQHVKLSREWRATIAAAADLAGRFQAQLKTDEFLAALFGRLQVEFASEPARYGTLLTDLNDLIQASGGLSATTRKLA